MTLRVEGLAFQYHDAPLLQGIELEVAPGESGFLLGPSGIGKSTVLRCIAGLETTYTGTISWQGESVDGLPTHRRATGMLFQEPALFPHLNAWKNVAFGLRYRGLPKDRHRGEATHWLELVGLGDRADAGVDELSGGQRQRIALARTLAAQPRVVLLDEPFSALDRSLRDDLGQRVKAWLHEQGVAALWVTHDEEEAARLGDKVWRIVEGRAVPNTP